MNFNLFDSHLPATPTAEVESVEVIHWLFVGAGVSRERVEAQLAEQRYGHVYAAVDVAAAQWVGDLLRRYGYSQRQKDVPCHISRFQDRIELFVKKLQPHMVGQVDVLLAVTQEKIFWRLNQTRIRERGANLEICVQHC